MASDNPQLEQNKKVVVELYEKGLNQKNFDAVAHLLGSRYIQHNPGAPDGADGLKAYIQFLREKYPGSVLTVKRVIAEGDYVVLHVHGVLVPGTRGKAIIDIFRLDAGKVVEHWDAVQDIPETAANRNGMF